MTAVKTVDAVFDSEPFPHLQKSLSLFRSLGQNILPRAIMTVVIGWFPLLIIVAAESLKNPASLTSFLTDVGVNVRSLIAAPFFIFSERLCMDRLGNIARHFINSGIIDQQDRAEYEALGRSTRSLMNATIAEILAVIGAYLFAFELFEHLPILVLRPWILENGTGPGVSVAGLWYVFVSMPLLVVLFFGWLWRTILWGRFLIKVSRLNLRLIAAHPDRASGLKFLDSSLQAFMPVAFTLGVIGAGSMANRVLHQGAPIEGLKKTVIGLTICVLVMFVGPLVVFVFKLHHRKVSGVFSYGELAAGVGRQFEQKWLANYDKFSSGALEASDFSATTDLYQVVANVHDMKLVPFEIRAVIMLVVVTLLPFVPVVLMFIPLKQVMDEILKLLV